MVFVPRHKRLANELAAFRPNRDVLQVRIGRRKPPRLRERLRVCRVHTPLVVDQRRQLVHIRRLELRAGPVFENGRDDRMLPRELRKRLLIRRPLSARRLLPSRQAEFAEEQLAELLRTVRIEPRIRILQDLLREAEDLAVQFTSVLLQRVNVDLHALALHLQEQLHKRLLDL